MFDRVFNQRLDGEDRNKNGQSVLIDLDLGFQPTEAQSLDIEIALTIQFVGKRNERSFRLKAVAKDFRQVEDGFPGPRRPRGMIP
jgi:hypothetical protein